MPEFLYLVRDASGQSVRGTGTAPDASALAARLRAGGKIIVEITPALPAPTGHAVNRSRLRALEVEHGLRQLASMIHGGITLLEALRALGEQGHSPRIVSSWNRVAHDIEQGSSFADALAASPQSFTPHVVELIRIGEASGTLDQAMIRAAQHLERHRELRLTVANALAYPAVVTLLALAVTIFLVVFVIPKLQKYLAGRGRQLPQLTTVLLDVATTVQSALPLLGIGLAAGALVLVCLHRWPPGRLALDHAVLRLPIVGGVVRQAGTALVARGLGILLLSGVTLLDALAATARLPGNKVLQARLVAARSHVMGGSSLAHQLSDPLVFLPMLAHMIAVGERAGTLTHVLDEAARFAESQLLSSIRRMSLLIEPVVILVVGGIVGFVYIAFFLALFSLAGNTR